MKRLVMFIAFGFLLVYSACGQSTATVTLAWNLSTATDVKLQTLGYGQINGSFTNLTTLGRTVTQFQVTNLQYSTTYYFAVSCTTSNGMSSVWSVPLQYTTTNSPAPLPPPAPTGLKVLSVP